MDSLVELITDKIMVASFISVFGVRRSPFFTSYTYTGTGASNSVSGIGFQPDFVWIKSRDSSSVHTIFDSTRGATKYLSSDSDNSETTGVQTLTSFDSDGFTVGTNVLVNNSAEDYIAWCMKEASGYFDIVSYTGTGSAHNENHNLGGIPALMLVKQLDDDPNYDWAVYHEDAGETGRLILNQTGAFVTNTGFWNDTAPTSSVFTVGTDVDVNESGKNYIAYLFAEVAGITKMGSFTGNGISNGPSITLGFRPSFLLVKNADSTGNWYLYDTRLGSIGQLDGRLIPDDTSDEATVSHIDVNENGFQVITTDPSVNNSGDKIVYFAMI